MKELWMNYDLLFSTQCILSHKDVKKYIFTCSKVNKAKFWNRNTSSLKSSPNNSLVVTTIYTILLPLKIDLKRLSDVLCVRDIADAWPRITHSAGESVVHPSRSNGELFIRIPYCQRTQLQSRSGSRTLRQITLSLTRIKRILSVS